MTEGEYRVGIEFNPSNSDAVYSIKKMAAALIDAIHTIDDKETGGIDLKAERRRLKALAKDAVEEAAMWAVKAATKRVRGL